MERFSFSIKIEEGFHAFGQIDSIINLITKFKKEFDTVIEDIKITRGRNDGIDSVKVILNGCDLVFSCNYISLEAQCDIDKFNKIYNYLLPLTRYSDLKVGDVVYYTEGEAIIKEILENDRIKITYITSEEETTAYKSWVLKFN